ncbi:unnamed protein product [Protopolystoma xenopodis]|uniref:Uncharacterized protein n=1 Tax=Protopolystoma xenopodis TaxID=117903 RepID=A0A448WMC8_9PLAT|nr:unnamed protein product [Protopolystoma xenopodis]
MHFLTIFWKVLFAFVPPTGKRVVIDLKYCYLISGFYVKEPCILTLET